MLRVELPGKRKRGRPKSRFMDVMKEDMAEVEVTEEDAEEMGNPLHLTISDGRCRKKSK